VPGVAADAFIAGGLEEVSPPKNEPVFAPAAAPLAAVPFVADIPRLPNGGGFFLFDPDNPSTAGWFGFMLVEGSRVGLLGGAGRLSAPKEDAVPVHQHTHTHSRARTEQRHASVAFHARSTIIVSPSIASKKAWLTLEILGHRP
jgi:hypothetical protein